MHDRVLLTPGSGAATPPALFAASFLVRPGRFPEEIAGRPCGGEAADLLLPAGPYRIEGLDPAQLRRLGGRFGGFCVPVAAGPTGPPRTPDRPDPTPAAASGRRSPLLGSPASPAAASPPGADRPVELSVFAAPPRSFRRTVPAGWRYSFDLDPRPERLRLAGWGFCALLERRAGGAWRAGLWVTPGDRRGFLGACTNLLRVVAAYRLLDAGGALLHSAAVAHGGLRGGDGTLFVGRSGAGKSTVARQARGLGLGVLSDELAALIPVPGGCAVAALPFAGDLEPAREPVPPLRLVRVLLLEQAGRDALVPASRARAVAAAAACAPWINADPHRATVLLDNLGRLLAGVEVARLEFTRGGGFWPLLELPEAA